MMNFEQWNGFEGRIWKEEINTRDFIQKNYTVYDGDSSFLADATPATDKLWSVLQKLQKEERAKGGVLDMETEVVSTLTAYAPGYIDPELKDLEKVVGLQTDKPLKRAFMPFGGIKLAVKACETNGYMANPKFEKIFNEYCRTHNITVSCDLNYRGKLWTKQEAGRVMAELVPYVDVLIANEADAADVFGIVGEGSDVESGKLNKEGYVSVAEQLVERFGVKKVAITLRTSLSAFDNLWAGMLYDAATKNACFSTEYKVHIVDRVGGGDSFGGGLIYALIAGKDTQGAIDFAVAASCLKHSIEHDFNLVKVKDVEALAAGNGTGRVQR